MNCVSLRICYKDGYTFRRQLSLARGELRLFWKLWDYVGITWEKNNHATHANRSFHAFMLIIICIKASYTQLNWSLNDFVCWNSKHSSLAGNRTTDRQQRNREDNDSVHKGLHDRFQINWTLSTPEIGITLRKWYWRLQRCIETGEQWTRLSLCCLQNI